MTVVVDSHTLIWFLLDDPKLGRQARETLKHRKNIEIIVPIIVLFEITHLKKKKHLPISMEEIRNWIAGNDHIRVYPVDMSILDLAPRDLEIHDGIIAGTAIALEQSGSDDVFVATCDKSLTACKAIKTLW
jgi:PIN domain nuclease of toxin-antitoxin system